MERLEIELDEFTRFAWVSQRAREIWEARFRLISMTWESVEVQAVKEGVKDACLQSIGPQDLPDLSERLAQQGLVAVPLGRQGTSNTYQNASHPYEEGKPWVYRVLICKPETVVEFLWAWRANDDWCIGELLGYPECCRNFYDWSWKKGQWRDVALTSVVGEIHAKSLEFPTHLTFNGFFQNNVFLRQLGVRMVSHLPCSPICTASTEVAEDLARVATKNGFATTEAWTREILQWPFRWTSLHGIAILTTPVVKIIYNTDPLSEVVEITKVGDVYPAEGGRGEFPFQENVHAVNIFRSLNAEDNGFSSVGAMLKAHEMILDGVKSLPIPLGARVIDLGCGDGQLLQSIVDLTRLYPVGVESNKDRFAKACARFKGKPCEVYNGDIFEEEGLWDLPYFLCLISISRFHEATPEQAKTLLNLLHNACEHVIIYNYSSDKWAGYIGMMNNFVMERFLTGPNSCAALVRPMKVQSSKELV